MDSPQPTFFIPHGGGPCFFMEDPAGTWSGMVAFLRTLPSRLPHPPSAILLISGHWETPGFALTAWATAPAARLSHPAAEHLLPLMVAAGAANAPGARIYAERVLEVDISGYRLG